MTVEALIAAVLSRLLSRTSGVHHGLCYLEGVLAARLALHCISGVFGSEMQIWQWARNDTG
jgi:hypothetical protein